MKRKGLFTILLLVLLVFLISCANESGRRTDNENNDNNSSEEIDGGNNLSTSNRKIIYTVDISLKSNDLPKTTNEIKGLLKTDEWIDSERLTKDTNYLIVRVKSSRLTTFTNTLKDNYETNNYQMDSTDISLDYIDVSAKKESLELELSRLLELYENASINEMININRRISEVENELRNINKRLNEYDSLIDYSIVKIWIYGPKASPTPPSYKSKISKSFKNGIDAVKLIFTSVSQLIVFFIPLLIIVLPVGGIVAVIIYYNKRKKDKNNKE